MPSQANPAPGQDHSDRPELPYASQATLAGLTFRHYAATEPGSPGAQERKARGLPAGAFHGLHSWGPRNREQITLILHGTMTATAGLVRLKDVDDSGEVKGRPGVNLDQIMTVAYQPDGADGPGAPVRIPGHEWRDLRSPQWPARLGIDGAYPTRRLADVANLVAALNRGHEDQDAYAKAGVLRRPGKPPVWLRFGGPALMPAGSPEPVDETARAELHPDYADIAVLRELTFSLPSTDATAAGDIDALFAVRKVYPDTPGAAVALIAELGWAPHSSDLGRVGLVIVGDSGEAGKTSVLDALNTAAQSATHEAGPQVEGIVFDCRNKGTALGLDQVAHPARGCIVTADDMITVHMSPAERAKALAKMDGFLDGINTGAGAVRGGHARGRSTFSVNRAPTGCGVITCEEIPAEDRLISMMGRAVAIRLHNPADVTGWSKALSYIQDRSRAIGRAYSRYITDHLAAMPEPARREFEIYRETVAGWHREYGGHRRTVNAYARLCAGWVLMARHRARLKGIKDKARDREIAEGLDQLRELFRAQARRSGKVPGARPATDPAELFARMAHDELAAGGLCLADPELAPGGEYQPPQCLTRAQWQRLGWRPVTGQHGPSWVPVRPGAPAGAVLGWDGRGRPPRYQLRLMVLPADLERLTAVLADRAMRGPVPVQLPTGLPLRERLTAAGLLHRADAVGQDPVWGEPGKPRRYVLDLAPILAGTLGGPDPEPPDEPLAEPPPLDGAPGPGIPEPPAEDAGWGPGTIGADMNPPARAPVEHGRDIEDQDHEPGPGASAAGPGCPRHQTVWGPHSQCPDCRELAQAPRPAPAAPGPDGLRELAGPVEPDSPPEPPEPPDEPGPPGPGRLATRARPEQGRRAAPRREPMARGDRLGYFGRKVREQLPDATDREVSAGLDVLERQTGGLRVEGTPAMTGVLWWHALNAQHGAAPELRRDEDWGWLGERFGRLAAGPRICAYYATADPAVLDRAPGAAWLTGTDVNAMFAAAAQSLELGTGAPQRFASLDAAHLKMPGYVVLPDPAGLPGPLAAIRPGEAVPMPMIKLLCEWADAGRCAMPATGEVLAWPEHRRWMGTFARRCLDVRAALLGREDIPGRLALAYLKAVYAATLGGMLASSRHNRTALLQPSWPHMIKGQSAANMWRGSRAFPGLAHCDPGPAAVITDAAYFLAGEPGARPAGLDFTPGKPGKWKVHRICELTDELRAAIAASKPAIVQRLAKAGHDSRGGQ